MVSLPAWILWVDNASISSWELQPITKAAFVTAANRKEKPKSCFSMQAN